MKLAILLLTAFCAHAQTIPTLWRIPTTWRMPSAQPGATPAITTYTVVGAASADTNTATATINATSATCAEVTVSTNGEAFGVLSDAQSNSYTLDASYETSSTGEIISFAHATITPTSSLAITYTKAGSYPRISVLPTSGGVCAVDTAATSSGTVGGCSTTSPLATGSITPSATGRLFLGGLMSYNGSAATLSSSPDFTLGYSQAAAGDAVGNSLAYYVDTRGTPSTENLTFAVSGFTFSICAGTVVYK